MLKQILYIFFFSTIGLMATPSGDINQTEVLLNRLDMKSDKIYVIDFFASWCKSCQKELPLISKVHNDKLVEVIGINVDKKKEDGEKFVKSLELPFRIIYDEDKSFIKSFDPVGFPALYYMKNGKVIHMIVGAVDNIDEQIAKDLKELK